MESLGGAGRKASHAFETTGSKEHRASRQQQALKAEKAKEVHVEKFSGLRIHNRLVAQMVVQDKFDDLKFVRVQHVRNNLGKAVQVDISLTPRVV